MHIFYILWIYFLCDCRHSIITIQYISHWKFICYILSWWRILSIWICINISINWTWIYITIIIIVVIAVLVSINIRRMQSRTLSIYILIFIWPYCTYSSKFWFLRIFFGWFFMLICTRLTAVFICMLLYLVIMMGIWWTLNFFIINIWRFTDIYNVRLYLFI